MGLKLVEPLAIVVVNDPGVMASVVAPVVAQLSILLAPDAMLVGVAVNEAIAGTAALPAGLDGPPDAQPPTPAITNKITATAQRCTREPP